MARPVFEPRRVADRVGVDLVTLRQRGFIVEREQQIAQRRRALGLVPMDGGEQTQPDRVAAARRSLEHEARQPVDAAAVVKLTQR